MILVHYEHLLVEITDSIARITLNRPDKRNSLSLALMQELTACLKETGASPDVRAVILAGAGPAFSAGHDLKEMMNRTINEYRQIFDACVEMMETLQHIPQPVIAEVHAMATAAGCQLVATCDLVIASEEARFATPGVRIGLFCSTPMVALTRVIGRKRALEMLLTGRAIDAQTAADWGLVNRVVPAAALKEETLQLARQIVEASPLTLGLGKQAFYAQIDLDQQKAYAYTKEVMSMNAMAEDAQEGMGAFLEKRVACWRGR
jgi:enoyl-CoA hydratase/carnithine racemase